MFVCQICGVVVAPRTPAARVVLQRRPRQYPFRRGANVFRRPEPSGKMKEHTTDDPGGSGWEIAVEVMACPGCAASVPPDT
jgi:hypothetical protein